MASPDQQAYRIHKPQTLQAHIWDCSSRMSQYAHFHGCLLSTVTNAGDGTLNTYEKEELRRAKDYFIGISVD